MPPVRSSTVSSECAIRLLACRSFSRSIPPPHADALRVPGRSTCAYHFNMLPLRGWS